MEASEGGAVSSPNMTCNVDDNSKASTQTCVLCFKDEAGGQGGKSPRGGQRMGERAGERGKRKARGGGGRGRKEGAWERSEEGG